MSNEIKKINISADLDDHEVDLLASLLRGYITEHREMAKVKQLLDEITQTELKWHLGHADFTETIAKKLFPGWK